MFILSCDDNQQHKIQTQSTEAAVDQQHKNEHETMVSRLQNIAAMANPMTNSFMNVERLAFMEPSAPISISHENINHMLKLGNERLRAGNSMDAVDLFQKILNFIELNAQRYTADDEQKTRRLLAIALLRVGEQSNCIMLHGNDSCIFPISPAAVHLNQQGSQQAMQQYQLLLQQDPNDLVSKWLYNLAAQTIGLHPDGIKPEWLIPMSLFESKTVLKKFKNIAPNNGSNLIDLAGSVVAEDFNNDGYMDILTSGWNLSSQLRLLLNDHNGQFIDSTEQANITGISGGLNMVQADYDNDGDIDVLVLRGAWLLRSGRHPNSLLRNNGDGTFTDVTESSGMLSFHPTQTAAWADVDNDGWLDLFIGNESLPNIPHPGELYHNQGDGTFINIAEQAGLNTKGFVKGATWGDYNNDGKIDLYISRMNYTNQLMKNISKPDNIQFVDVAKQAGVQEPLYSFPTWFWDFDNDGWLDIFVADFSADAYSSEPSKSFNESQAFSIIDHYLNGKTPKNYPRLYRNLGNGTFADVTKQQGLQQPLLAMGANFGDLNNDGYLDMYIGTGSPDFRSIIPNRMFLNDQGQSFIDVTHTTVTGHLQKGHGISFTDMDNDGDQDIYAVMGGVYSSDVFQNAFFENPGFGNNWITIQLQGTQSSRSAIGSRVTINIKDNNIQRTVHRHVSSGGSFGANSLQLEIGLNQAESIDQLIINWPSGEKSQFSDIDVNQKITIIEGQNSLTKNINH